MHLSDCFLELFTFIRYFADSHRNAGVGNDVEYEVMRADVNELIARMEEKARQYKATPEQYNMARFAVFAWIDETVLCTSWSGTRQWLKHPLQRQYYETVNAGEEFFEQLDVLLDRRKTAERHFIEVIDGEYEGTEDAVFQEVLEVYALCLSLGFTGRFFHDSQKKQLEQLRIDCLNRLLGKVEQSTLDVFPDAYGKGQKVKKASVFWRLFDPLGLIFVVLPLIVSCGMYLAYNGLLEYSLKLWFGE